VTAHETQPHLAGHTSPAVSCALGKFAAVLESTRSQGDAMPTTLSTDAMKAKVRSHFEDFVNNRKPEVIRTNMTADFYDHDGPGGRPTDVSGDEQMMRQMYKVMPDLHLTIEDLIAERDKVVCKNHWRWTDRESGKKMGFRGFVMWRFEGDKIAERWATVTQPAEDSPWD
jgi:predicted ester cyclase